MEALKSHFSCVLIWRRNPVTHEYEFLVIDVVSTKDGRPGRKKTKFPGGNSRPNCVPAETPEFIAQREALEETGLIVTQDELDKIWEKQAPPDSDKPGEHTKHGFLVSFEACHGSMRTQEQTDNGDTMSAPYWLSVSDLKMQLFAGHQEPFICGCQKLGIF